MKKIIALIAVLATLVSLSACKVNKTAEERQAEIAAEQSKAAAASEKAEKEYQEGMDKTVDKLGKTEKGERLVVKEPGVTDPSYLVFEFDKKEVLKNRYKYIFYATVEAYENMLDGGDGVRRELVDHDDKSRMLVYEVEFEETPEFTFDYFYNMYTQQVAVDSGYEIIE